MRKRSVGLLGNVTGEKRPQPFVEDTAVPPEHLADYIAEFRALLDGQGLALRHVRTCRCRCIACASTVRHERS